MEIPRHRKVTHIHAHKPPKIKPNTQRKNPPKTKMPNNTHKIPIHSNGFDHCLASLSTFPYWYIFLSYPIATKTLHLLLSLPPEHHLSLHRVFRVEGSEVIYSPYSASISTLPPSPEQSPYSLSHKPLELEMAAIC